MQRQSQCNEARAHLPNKNSCTWYFTINTRSLCKFNQCRDVDVRLMIVVRKWFFTAKVVNKNSHFSSQSPGYNGGPMFVHMMCLLADFHTRRWCYHKPTGRPQFDSLGTIQAVEVATEGSFLFTDCGSRPFIGKQIWLCHVKLDLLQSLLWWPNQVFWSQILIFSQPRKSDPCAKTLSRA